MNAPLPMQIELLLRRVLRVGTAAGTIFLGGGLGLALLQPGVLLGDGLMRAGLVVLLATPVARVVVLGYEYAAERDWVFVTLTAAVLLLLLGSLLVALLG